MPSDYLRRVCESYQGESYGQVLFRELAKRTKDSEKKYKWRVLECLETETKRKLLPLVQKLGGDTRESPENIERGIGDAKNMAAKEWGELMRSFHEMLPKYVRFFEKLEALAPTEDKDLLRSVTAHEIAIQEFAAKELSGDGDHSLEAILNLLDEPPGKEGG
ncbi:hypothetical protein MK292_04575 [Myxococcota bacterium]|nr:hypothetical protein [Myxococcota bacterium]|tara:strand:- start:714 stop:1199 length:486 start_codon:yes stop_codon:yes gene_type:complete